MNMNWKSTEFRRRMAQQLSDIINSHPHYSPNASPVQLESAAFNRSSTQEEYIKNVRSVILMVKQQQQRQVQQPQQQQQHGPSSSAHLFREHQIQSMRQQMLDQQHSMNAPSYPMMPQQQPPQQQPQTLIDPGTRPFMTHDHPPQQQMYDSGRSNMTSASYANVPYSASLYMKSGPAANITITTVSSSLPSSLPTSGLSFSVAPQPTAVDGSTVTAHYGASGQQRSPYNVQNYPTSTTAAASLPATSQGHMEPSMSSLLSQPSPSSPATSAEEEQQYIQKKHELSQYIPTVMKVINKYTSRGTPEDAQRLQQVAKLRDFVKMLQDNTRRIPLSALAKWEVALKKIFPSTSVESSVASDSMVSAGAPSSMHPPSSQPTMPQASSTHTISSRAPQLELQSTNSPTLSYSTPTIRENQLALQLLCKQHEKKETTCCVKSLPVIQRELEHLEDYFMYKQEIDSNENCIVLTCSLVSDYLADIPPLVVRIPDSYPNVPPEYVMNGYQNNSLLLNIEKYVGKQLTSMNLYSVTQLLHAWESSVRNAVKDIVALA